LNAGGSGGSDIDRGITRFAQDYASNAYQQAFNNFSAQRKDIYNTLAGIAGIGQTGQTATNAAAQNYGTNAANLATGIGNAQAAGTIGQANAYGNALSQIGGMSYVNNLTRQPAPIQTGPTSPSLIGSGAQQSSMQGSYFPTIG
jgi:hypothetical protein